MQNQQSKLKDLKCTKYLHEACILRYKIIRLG